MYFIHPSRYCYSCCCLQCFLLHSYMRAFPTSRSIIIAFSTLPLPPSVSSVKLHCAIPAGPARSAPSYHQNRKFRHPLLTFCPVVSQSFSKFARENVLPAYDFLLSKRFFIFQVDLIIVQELCYSLFKIFAVVISIPCLSLVRIAA